MKKILSLLMMTLLCVTAWAGSETITFKDLGYANAGDVTSVKGTNVALTFAKGEGSNAPKYYTSGEAVRMYANNTLTITSDDNITAISIEADGNNTFANGTFDVGTKGDDNLSWAGRAKTVVYTMASTGQTRIKAITITTEGSEPQPAEFGIKVTPEPAAGQVFDAPVQVSIELLNGTEDAMATYKLDDGQEIDYTEPFTLYKTTTVTVNALNGDDDMTEATWTGTYTINLPELAFTLTPEPGTYRGEQNVTIACTNAVAPLTIVWAYTPENGEPIVGDENNLTFTAAASGVLTIMAEEEATGREYNNGDEGQAYVIKPIVVPDGMIVFQNNDADSNTALTAAKALEQIEKGVEYVESVTQVSYVYPGEDGLKFSSSKNNGTLVLKLADEWNATKVTVIAKNWPGTAGKPDEAKLQINGKGQQPLDADWDEYVYTPAEGETLSEISLYMINRGYVKAINIEGTKVVKPITVTFDPDGGTFDEPVNVKITAENLPEGAVVKYSILDEDEDFVVMDEVYTDQGVTMNQSGYIMAVVYDAQGQYLYDADSEDFIINIPEPVITFTPQPGEYDEPVTVMVEVENMPQDAKITYTYVLKGANAPLRAEGGVTELDYQEGGIELTQSGLLTVYVRDAQGQELTSAEGEYTIKGSVTGIEALTAGKAVKGVRYYNVAGQAGDQPFNGMNIVVVTYQDGTHAVAKMAK